MMRRFAARAARLERSEKLVALVKLANVGFTMIWGFAVTYVFVRALPIGEFRAFLLLVAFGNFTASAEFGVTAIAYARLRRHWLGQVEDGGDFRLEEIGFLLAVLIGLVAVAALVMGGLMLGHVVHTGYPMLFMLFFVSACFNAVLLLMKRALAATEHNLFWEVLDVTRRIATLAILLAVLAGFDITISVALQLLFAVIVLVVAAARLHRRTGMCSAHWFGIRAGARHVRRHYARDFSATVALTLSEVAAYNAPYFTIAAATHDPRPMLLFDFVFKMARGISLVVRAFAEAAMPKLTAAYYDGNRPRFSRLLARALLVAGGAALAAGLAICLLGKPIVAELFDGRIAVSSGELALLALLMLVLSITCVSVHLQVSLGRFAIVLRQSLPFLAGSLLSVPVATVLAPVLGMTFSLTFLIAYTLVFAGTATLHAFSLARLNRSVRRAS
jgi:O-antigen/teichoic acid export membrane protein